jgi:hypothetical protein
VDRLLRIEIPKHIEKCEIYRTGQLAEFLPLNHLFCLERDAIDSQLVTM